MDHLNKNLNPPLSGKRLRIAFFDYPDVFEDFYTHYDVAQSDFDTWHNTGNHSWLEIIQKDIGGVTWYITSIKPELTETVHKKVGCKLKFLSSSWLHRILWKAYYLPSFAWRWKHFYRRYAVLASYLAPLSFSLIKSLCKDKPDVIFVQDYCSGKFDVLLFFSWILNVPLLTFHSGSTSGEYLGKYFKKYTISRARWIFSSGSNESLNLVNNFNVDQGLINIIRPPIDTEIYRIINKADACLKLDLNSAKRYLLFVGRFDDSVKRISSIIRVFHKLAAKYPDVDLLLIGGGNDEKKLKNQSEDLVPGRVLFRGWISEDSEKALYYNVSECLILASWREGFPTVIGEAFSCGIPVVSSNVGGINDMVIDGKSGWLFSPGDDEALLRHLDYVLASPEKIKLMRSDVRKIAEGTVSIPVIRKALLEGFTTVLENEKQSF